MQALRELEAVYAEWEKQVKDEARRAVLIESVEMLCDAFELELSDERRDHLASLGIPELKELFAVLSKTRRWPEG